MDPKLMTVYSPLGVDLRCESCKIVVLSSQAEDIKEGITMHVLVRAMLRHSCAN